LKKLFYILTSFLISFPILAEDALDINFISNNSILLLEYTTVLEDKTKSLTMEDILKPENQSRFDDRKVKYSYNFSHTNSAYWLKINLKNLNKEESNIYLEISYFLLEFVDLYKPAGEKYNVSKSGFSVLQKDREYQSRFFVFPFTIPANSTQSYYLRVASDNAINLPISLWTAKDFHTHEKNHYAIQTIYLGILISMVLYNLFISFLLRSKDFLLYVIFTLMVGMSFLSISGLLAEAFSNIPPQFIKILPMFFATIGMISFLFFIRRTLHTKTISPKLDKVIIFFIGILFASILPLIIRFKLFARVSILFFLFTSILILSVLILYSLKKVRSAYFFLLAFLFFFLTMILAMLRAVGIIPTNAFTYFGPQLGSVVEMLLFAFALADRYNTFRMEKEKAEKTVKLYLEKSNQELEQKVKQRTKELEEANRELSRMAKQDGLTKIANRRMFDEYLQTEWIKHLKQNECITLILIDIDFFKNYNDYYGHLKGDDCLVQVATAIQDIPKKPSDLVSRYGGEEFAVLLPNTSLSTGLVLAEEIRNRIESLAIPNNNSMVSPYVTLSLGVAAIVPRPRTSPEDLIHIADSALYQAKKLGRNRVIYTKRQKKLPTRILLE